MNVRVEKIILHLKNPFKLSRGTTTERENVIVDVDGNYGEGAPLYYLGQTSEEILQGAVSIIDYLTMNRTLDHLQENPWPRELENFPNASLCAVSQAVYGYLASQNNKPLYKKLGLTKPENISTSYTISIGKPEDIEKAIADNPGYNSYKMKIGSDDDIEAVKKFRELSDAELRLDVNGGWSYNEAIEKMRVLENYNIEFIEQPLPKGSLEELDMLTSNTNIPVFVDEDMNNFSDILELNGKVHGINIKLSKCGSILDSIRIIQYAKQVGMKILLGCMVESSIGITAAYHLSSLADYVDLDGNILIDNDPYEGVNTENGILTLNDRTGLGVTKR